MTARNTGHRAWYGTQEYPGRSHRHADTAVSQHLIAPFVVVAINGNYRLPQSLRPVSIDVPYAGAEWLTPIRKEMKTVCIGVTGVMGKTLALRKCRWMALAPLIEHGA